MNYQEFSVAYNKAFTEMMKYKPNEIGSAVFAEKMADLSDKYPEFVEIIENDC